MLVGRHSVYAIGLTFGLLLSSGVRAQALEFPAQSGRAVALDSFVPALDAESFLGVQGTRTPDANSLSLGLFTGYASNLLRADRVPGGRFELVQHRLSGYLSTELGIGDRAAFGLALPLVLYEDGQRFTATEPKLDAFAVGDPQLSLRYRFLGTSGATARRDGPGLALQLGTSLPAGDRNAFVGESSPLLHAQLLADMHLLGAGVGGSIGFLHRFESRELYTVALHDAFTFGAALKLPIPPLYTLAGILEFRGATDFKSSATTSLEGELGLRYSLGSQLALTVAAGAGFSHGVGTPAFRAIAGLHYSPAELDSDHDGIPDKLDACPFLPEDHDGYQDRDGCPDPDNDNDLVPDADDLCPNEAAVEGRDADEDGCTDK